MKIGLFFSYLLVSVVFYATIILMMLLCLFYTIADSVHFNVHLNARLAQSEVSSGLHGCHDLESHKLKQQQRSNNTGSAHDVVNNINTNCDLSECRTANRNARHDSDSDESCSELVQPYKPNKNCDNIFPVVKRKSDHYLNEKNSSDNLQDFDQSPPRKKMCSDSERLTARSKYYNQPSPRKANEYSNQSPPRKKYDSDESSHPKICDSYLSPFRRMKKNSDQPLATEVYDSDQSPPRKKCDSDLSPCRSNKGSVQSSTMTYNSHCNFLSKKKKQENNAHYKNDSELEMSKTSKTMSGAKSGLSTAIEMRQEAEILKKMEENEFSAVSCSCVLYSYIYFCHM